MVYHARDMAVVRARFCAAPAVLVSATPSLETLANVEAGRYRRITLPTRHGGAVLPSVAAVDLRADAAGARALPRAAADRRGARHAGARRAGDAVPQPPRLCAADAVPALRPPHAVPELHRLAGGAPRAPRAAMPPLRPHRADPRGVSGLRCGEQPGAGRAGRGAHHRGGRGAVPRRAAAGHGERHDARPARRRRRRARDRGARGGPDHRHPDRRQGLALSASDAWSAWWTPTWAWPAAICARRNGPCSCCTRWPGARAGPRRRGGCCCRPSRPSIR